jgi:hypothetical protein
VIPKVLDNKAKFMTALAFTFWLTLMACTVSVKDKDQSDNNKVDIETPIGGLHVNEGADVRDTGLTVYPGARPKPKTNDGDGKSANVNISSGFFGLKVVALEYESDDSPEKLIAFYQDQLKKFGNVVRCRAESHGGDMAISVGRAQSKAVSCEGGNQGQVVELKTGTEDNQHLVSIEPNGKGSNFSLVYIRARGKEGSI